MGKYFGTDGVRGEANIKTTPELAFKLGRFGGCVLSQHETESPKVFVGRDTRISGNARICLGGRSPLCRDSRLQTWCPYSTPAVAYLVKTGGSQCGCHDFC